MKILNTIKKILYSSTFIFTLSVFIIAMFYSFTVDEYTLETKGIQMEKYIPLYAFSLILAALNHLLTYKRLSLGLRIPLHFIGTMASVYVIFINILKLGQTNHGKFASMLVLSLIYGAILGICFLVRTGFLRLCGNIRKKSQKAENNNE